jgi:hypothetical protein
VQPNPKCNLSRNNIALASTPSAMNSIVPLAVFQQFILAVESKTIDSVETDETGLR